MANTIIGVLDDYTVEVYRLEPQMLKGKKIAGFLREFKMPVSIPEIIEDIGCGFGGGKFQIKIFDEHGVYAKSKTFEISGFPKIPDSKAKLCQCPLNKLLAFGCRCGGV